MSTMTRTVSATHDSTSWAGALSATQRGVIAVSLTLSWLLGLAGTYLPAGSSQDLTLTISSVALVIGCGLLAIWAGHNGWDTIAVGFAVLGLGEVIILAAGPMSVATANSAASGILATGYGTVASGFALYAAGLALISIPSTFSIWVRIPGVLAAVPFTAHTVLYLTGSNPNPLHGPLSGMGYTLLTLAILGWTALVIRRRPTLNGAIK